MTGDAHPAPTAAELSAVKSILNRHCAQYGNCTQCPIYDIDVMEYGNYVSDCPVLFVIDTICDGHTEGY